MISVRTNRTKKILMTGVVLLTLIAGLFLPAAVERASSKPALKPVRFMVQWVPQAQFAGYYMALEKGFYEEAGLDVTILRGGPDRDSIERLTSGDVQFITTWLSTALIERDKGLPIVNISQIVNESNQVLIGWKNHGIFDIKDLTGRRVSVWEGAFRPAYLAFLKANDIDAKIVPQYYSINLFMHKGVDLCSAMYYNEYHMLYQMGVEPDEVTVFFLKDYGYNLPEDGIYCLENTIRDNPQVAGAFAEASQKGWLYAAEHPDETLDVVMKYVAQGNVATNRPHMKWMLDKILPSIIPNERSDWKLGELTRQDYDQAVRLLGKQGLITSAASFEVFVNRGANSVQ